MNKLCSLQKPTTPDVSALVSVVVRSWPALAAFDDHRAIQHQRLFPALTRSLMLPVLT